MTCFCGSTDCPQCGPAQGYKVVRVQDGDGYVWANPEEEEETEEERENYG